MPHRQLAPPCPVLFLLLLTLCAPPVSAQATREELIRAAEEEKSRRLTPPRPNRAEAIMESLDDWGLLGEPRGLYPWIGSVYSGGGLAGGAGLRYAFADDGALNVFGGYSMARYARAQADVALPTFAQNRARVTMSAGYIDAPDVRFFGVGNDSTRDDAVRFGYRPVSAGARIDVRPARRISMGGGARVLDVSTSGGRTGPSIEARFDPSSVPGLGVSGFTFLNSTAYAEYDWRRSLGYSGRGGRYRIQFDDYRERDTERYSFSAVEAEVIQLVPIMRANWIVALRALATVTDIADSHDVPFFLLPSLGGGTTLRGYPDFRFRDRNRLLMNVELRWTPARFMDMAIFYDAGRVASRRADLGFDGLKHSYGIGMRLVGPQAYVMRVEVARSREHAARLIISAGGVF